jgi:predicted nucleic acid-binding protein
LVVDASVSVKWYLRHRADEAHVAEALAVLAAIDLTTTDLFAAPHWILETVSVLARIEPAIASSALSEMVDMRPGLVTEAAALSNAIALAVDLRHHLFDTLYHAVALEAGATLITSDDAYFAKAAHLGGIQRLADFRA